MSVDENAFEIATENSAPHMKSYCRGFLEAYEAAKAKEQPEIPPGMVAVFNEQPSGTLYLGAAAEKRAKTKEQPAAVEGEMDARDWPEDFAHENGNYQNLCCECGKLFFGHKRRVVCRSCVKQKEGLAKEQPVELSVSTIEDCLAEQENRREPRRRRTTTRTP